MAGPDTALPVQPTMEGKRTGDGGAVPKVGIRRFRLTGQQRHSPAAEQLFFG